MTHFTPTLEAEGASPRPERMVAVDLDIDASDGSPAGSEGAHQQQLSRRELLRAGVALPALALPFAAACGGSHHATAGSSSTTTTGSGPTGSTVAPPRGPRGSGQPVRFAFGGDVHFPDARDTVDPGALSGTPTLGAKLRSDPTHLLDPIAPVLSGADLAMVNLETAITERGGPVPGKDFHFRSPAESFVALKAAGVDVINMANNHALDYGPVGLEDTFAAIAASNVPVVGIGQDASEAYRPYRTVIKGQRIAIFGALDWLEPGLIAQWSATDTQPGLAFSIDRTRLLAAVAAVRPEVDTLIAFMHWGVEYTDCASSEQKSLGQALLAAGADIVVGSHAHRIFGAGRVGGSLVAYGLGNFVFWREDGEAGRSGVLLVEATGRQVDSYDWVPARIIAGIPVPAAGGAAAADLAEWANRRGCSDLQA